MDPFSSLRDPGGLGDVLAAKQRVFVPSTRRDGGPLAYCAAERLFMRR